jgi:transcriptional regulator with XRE-family HTH domain
MKFKEYIKKNKISVPKMCKELGIDYVTMNSYRYNDAIPRRENMQKIYKATNKEVKPNDFYGLY